MAASSESSAIYGVAFGAGSLGSSARTDVASNSRIWWLAGSSETRTGLDSASSTTVSIVGSSGVRGDSTGLLDASEGED